MVHCIMISAGSTGVEEPPGNAGFEGVAITNAAGHFQQFGKGHSHRHFIVAGAC